MLGVAVFTKTPFELVKQSWDAGFDLAHPKILTNEVEYEAKLSTIMSTVFKFPGSGLRELYWNSFPSSHSSQVNIIPVL